MITGAANRWSTGMSKNPWICALCRSIVSTRFAPGGAQQVRHQLGRDRHARLVLAVLPRVAVIRNHRRDARRRRAAERVDHHAQLHEVPVDVRARRLHDEDVGAADVLVDLERDLRVRETAAAARARPGRRGTPQSPRSSAGCALPEKSFSWPPFMPIAGPLSRSAPSSVDHRDDANDHRQRGWGGRIRTSEYGSQSPAPYRLATPHRGSDAATAPRRLRSVTTRRRRGTSRRGPPACPQKVKSTGSHAPFGNGTGPPLVLGAA